MQKDTKNYLIEGKSMRFDSDAFKELFNRCRKQAAMTVMEFETELGEELNVSNNAIHNWRFGMNGPADVETIKHLASCLGVKDYKVLLTIE